VNPHSTRDQAFFYFGNTAKFEIGRSGERRVADWRG